uniref:Uncharacterized protein n=1 Tax=Florenciella parvula TaxID=236787 RepID=A0A7S2D5U6_9STRA|mmetsp:Transcript_9425/g.19924  ORF Transcript_9425/g.19924 Transcript_9425/m.19924 type:complete len:233 (+) Transcript_9425:166-864(+)
MSMAGATRVTPHSDVFIRTGGVVRGATNSFRRQFSIERFEQTAKIALPIVAAAATGESRRRSMSYYQNPPPVSPIKPTKTVPTAPPVSHLQRAGAAAVGNVVRPQPRPASEPVTNARRASREAISRTASLTPIKKRAQVGAELTSPVAHEHAQGPPTKPTAPVPQNQKWNPAFDKSPVKEQLVSLLGALTTVLKVAQSGSLGQVHHSSPSHRNQRNRSSSRAFKEVPLRPAS